MVEQSVASRAVPIGLAILFAAVGLVGVALVGSALVLVCGPVAAIVPAVVLVALLGALLVHRSRTRAAAAGRRSISA